MRPTVTLLNQKTQHEFNLKLVFQDLLGITNQLTYRYTLSVDTKPFVTFQGPVVAKTDHVLMAKHLVENHAATRVEPETMDYIVEELKKIIPEEITVV